MQGRVLFVGVFLLLSVGFVAATPPAWLKQGASFTYHGYGSSNAGAATVFMTYTVQSVGADGVTVRRNSTEARYGTPVESKVLSYAPSDQAGDFWLDIAQMQTLKPGETVMVHTDAGYIPATLLARGPLELGDPQYGQQRYNDIIMLTVTGTGSDKTTQINYNYYYNGGNGLLISYSEYAGTDLGNPEQNLASKIIIYLLKANADFTTVSENPTAGTEAQTNPYGILSSTATSTTISTTAGADTTQQSSPSCCSPALIVFLSFSSVIVAKTIGF